MNTADEGRRRSALVYYTQVAVVYTVIVVCVVNLCLTSGDSVLWSSLLSSCIGYLLPNPKPPKIYKEEDVEKFNESV